MIPVICMNEIQYILYKWKYLPGNVNLISLFLLLLVFVSDCKSGFIDHFKVIVSRCLDLLSNQRSQISWLTEYFVEEVLLCIFKHQPFVTVPDYNNESCFSFLPFSCQCNYMKRKQVPLQFVHRIIVINSLLFAVMTFLPFSGLSLTI